MKSKYPNPCLACSNQCTTGGKHDYSKNCKKYINWICWWWLEFKRQARESAKPVSRPKHFVYCHPDEVREYLQNGPCKGCKAESICDLPCKAYLNWWDARMEILRRKVQT